MVRKSIVRLFVLGLGLVLLSTPLVAEARSLDEIIKSGVIRAGIETDILPLGGFNDKNELVGFDVDFSNKIAEMLGVKLEMVKILGTDRIPFVVSGNVDFSLGALTRNPARAKVIDYTLPLHTESFAVMTLEGKPFKHWKDLNDTNVTLVQVRGTTPLDFIKTNLPKAKTLLLDSNADIVRAIAQGRGDAIIDILDFLAVHMSRYNVKWKVLETPIEVYYCGVGVAKGNYTLRDWLNVAIFDLHKTGWVDEAWKKWFGGPMVFGVQASPYF